MQIQIRARLNHRAAPNERSSQWLASKGGRFLDVGSRTGALPGTSAQPPTGDLRAETSAIALITSAIPPGTDLLGGAVDSPYLTHCGLLELANMFLYSLQSCLSRAIVCHPF